MICAAVAAYGIQAWGASLAVTISAPSTQTTSLSDADLVTFDSLAVGEMTNAYVASYGTYLLDTNSKLRVSAANQYGGADGSRYVTFGSTTGTSAPITLQLSGAYNYFGFWWSAIDATNGVSFYDGSQLLLRVSGAAILSALTPTNGHVTALDGTTTYANSLYYGNPNSTPRPNQSQPYGYVEFITTGHDFNKIVFDNSASVATAFRMDNHALYAGIINLPGSSVSLGSYSIASPEPATFVLTAGALGVLAWRRRRS